MKILTLPIRTVSEANRRDHWAVKSARARQQRMVACVLVRRNLTPVTSPVIIRLIRLGTRKFDTDNLAGALKHIRDGIADAIGIDDGDMRLTWQYGQEYSPEIGVRVEIIKMQPAGRTTPHDFHIR